MVEEEEDEETDRFQRALVFGKKSSQALTWACGVCQSFFPFLSLPLSLLSLSPSLSLFVSVCLCSIISMSSNDMIRKKKRTRTLNYPSNVAMGEDAVGLRGVDQSKDVKTSPRESTPIIFSLPLSLSPSFIFLLFLSLFVSLPFSSSCQLCVSVSFPRSGPDPSES